MKNKFDSLLIFVLMVLCFLCFNVNVYGQTSENDIFEKYDFDKIQEFIDEDNEIEDIDFEQIISDFMSGSVQSGMDGIFKYIKMLLFDELIKNKSILTKILIVAVAAALFTNFTKILNNSQVSETGFTICYMMIMTFIISSFATLAAIGYLAIEKMTDFMKALIPVYMVSIGVGNGQADANSYYEMALSIITIIDIVCLKILLPLVNIYVMLMIINNLYSEEYFSKTCDLIKGIVLFSVKSMLTVVMGLNVVRQMFSPISNNVGNMTAKNLLGAVSGMGGSAGNITELVYGTGNILKNAVGGAGLVVLAVIVLIPIMKIAAFIFSYQITNAIIQPISDTRIVKCLEGVTNGAVLILRVIFAVSLMFVITIAIVCIKN